MNNGVVALTRKFLRAATSIGANNAEDIGVKQDRIWLIPAGLQPLAAGEKICAICVICVT